LHQFQQNGVNLIVSHKNLNSWFLPHKPDTLITLVNAFTHIHGVFGEMQGVFVGEHLHIYVQTHWCVGVHLQTNRIEPKTFFEVPNKGYTIEKPSRTWFYYLNK
jgi:hypothetical protein